jgi:hypothetical protein
MKSRFSEERIVSILKEDENGVQVNDIVRKYGRVKISSRACKFFCAKLFFLIGQTTPHIRWQIYSLKASNFEVG